MSIRKRLGRIGLPIAVAATTAIGLSSGALASPGALAGSGIVFSDQSVIASGNNVTIGVFPTNFAGAPVTYTQTATAAVTAGVPFTFTLTLPAGTTFTAVPAATGGPCFGGSPMTVALGGIGANFVTFNGSTSAAAAGAACSITLGAFNIAGAAALDTPNFTTFTASAAVSCNPALGCPLTDLTNPKAQLASSDSSIKFDTGPSLFGGGVELIDITAAGGFGTKFLQNGVDSVAGDDGAIGIAVLALVNAGDTGFFVPGATANISVTAAGGFGGIQTVYLTAPTPALQGAATTNACSATQPASAVTGVLTGNTATFFGVTLPGVGAISFYELCKIANGTTLIAANPTSPVVAVSSPSGAVTVFIPGLAFGTGTGSAAALNIYNYNGLVQTILYSLVDPAGLYRAFFQIVNQTNAAVTVFARAQSDTGSVGTGTIFSATSPLAANTSQLIAASTVVGNTGISLGSTGRFSVTFFIPSNPCGPGSNGAVGAVCTVGVNQQILSPNGTLILNGSGTAP